MLTDDRLLGIARFLNDLQRVDSPTDSSQCNVLLERIILSLSSYFQSVYPSAAVVSSILQLNPNSITLPLFIVRCIQYIDYESSHSFVHPEGIIILSSQCWNVKSILLPYYSRLHPALNLFPSSPSFCFPPFKRIAIAIQEVKVSNNALPFIIPFYDPCWIHCRMKKSTIIPPMAWHSKHIIVSWSSYFLARPFLLFNPSFLPSIPFSLVLSLPPLFY